MYCEHLGPGQLPTSTLARLPANPPINGDDGDGGDGGGDGDGGDGGGDGVDGIGDGGGDGVDGSGDGGGDGGGSVRKECLAEQVIEPQFLPPLPLLCQRSTKLVPPMHLSWSLH